MILPFFLTTAVEYTKPLVKSVNTLIDRTTLWAIERLGYKALEEVTADYRRTLRDRYATGYSYRSISRCEDYCSVMYKHYSLGICHHGNSIKVLKKITYNGNAYYK